MFNVISIFLGISVTSAMISGIEYVHGKLIIFYFFSCAWIALTILCLLSILLKKIDKQLSIVLIIYILYTIVWIFMGIKCF